MMSNYASLEIVFDARSGGLFVDSPSIALSLIRPFQLAGSQEIAIMPDPAERFLTRRQLVEFLNEHGYPISLSTLAKLAMPSCGEGPVPEGTWGNRLLYHPSKALRWAEGRFRSSRAHST
jgi:hypothetical protein